jgi:hypothetical protein
MSPRSSDAVINSARLKETSSAKLSVGVGCACAASSWSILFSLEGNAQACFDVAAIISNAGGPTELDRSVAGLDSQSAGKVPPNRRAAGRICGAACLWSGRCPSRTRGGSARNRSDPTYRRCRSIGNALRVGVSSDYQTYEHDSEREFVHLLPHQTLQIREPTSASRLVEKEAFDQIVVPKSPKTTQIPSRLVTRSPHE